MCRAPRLLVAVGGTVAAAKLWLQIADVTAYDACCVALAHRLGVSLITADNKLVNKLTGSPYPVTWLGAWAPPTASPSFLGRIFSSAVPNRN